MSRRPDRALLLGLAALALLLVADGAAVSAGAPPWLPVATRLLAFASAVWLVRRALSGSGADELRAERDRLRAAAESSGVGLWLNPLPLGQLVWNGAVRDHFHLPPGAPAPTIEGFYARLHPDDRAPTARAIEVALATRGLFDVEYRTVCPETGAVKFVRAVGRATYDGSGVPVRFDGVTLDLTAQKRAEAGATEESRRASAILESIGDAFFALDRDWRFTYLNRKAEELLGRAGPDLLGKGVWDEFAPALGTEFERGYRRAVAEGVAVTFEAPYAPHGRWYEVNAYPAPDARGAAGGISVYFRDVTERHRAADEIARLTAAAERERRLFEAALSNTSDLLYIFETDGRVAYANRALLQLWGKTAEEAVGKSLKELDYDPAVEAQLLGDIRRVVEARAPLKNETPYTSPAGVAGVYEYIFSPVFADGPGSPVTRVAGSTRDITGRKRAEAQLREAERFSRMLVEQVRDYAIFGTDPEGRATSWNEGVLRVLGYPEAEWVGRDIVPLIFTPEDIAAGVPAREFATAAATGSAGDDRTMMRKGGARFFALGVMSSLRGPGGELVGFTKVMRDQTDRKKLEDDLRQMASDLSEADRRKDEFLATLAHELRNPLAPLRTGLEVLRLGGASAANGAGEKARAMMERQLKQMVRLVDDLLDVSRITRNKLELRAERVDLAAVLAGAVETSRPLIEAGGHALDTEIAPEPMALEADFTRLAQVFSNLLNNAAKYTEPGGRITLSARPDPDSPGRVAVTVADTGVGIPAAMLPRVFDMFTQVDRSIARSQGGLGIGLTLVRRLVEMHGGAVTAESAGVGRGSAFTVRLPLAGAPDARPAPGEAPAAAPAPPRRILVVDDNEDSAASLSLLLGLTGNAVEVAYDGEEAVRAARDFAPDVILLDIGLPKLNGYEACERIRQLPGGASIVIVAQTGWGQDDDRKRSNEAGFDFHLVKPVDPAALGKLLAGLGR